MTTRWRPWASVPASSPSGFTASSIPTSAARVSMEAMSWSAPRTRRRSAGSAPRNPHRLRYSAAAEWPSWLSFAGAVSDGDNRSQAGRLLQRVSADELERPVPPRLREEVRHHVDNVVEPDIRIRQVRRGRLERPINDHRGSHDVLARNETPVAAVERIVAIV